MSEVRDKIINVKKALTYPFRRPCGRKVRPDRAAADPVPYSVDGPY